MKEKEENKQNEVSEVGMQLAGKYLTFKLAEEIYGIEILAVQEIIQMQDVTRVPRTPDYIRGVINLRGKVLPVVELRKKFDLETSEDTEKTCIVVVKIGSDDDNSITSGVIIDEVLEVADISAGEIQETPAFGSDVNTDFILGVGKVEDNVIMLLDIQKVFQASEVSTIAETTGS